jgi:hypothetical protein
MVNGLPSTAAFIASVGAAVTPKSRPGPYTLSGRKPADARRCSAQYTRAVSSLATL